MKLLMLVSFAFLAASAAHAAPVTGCKDVDALNLSVQKCSANKKYSAAGKKCLAGFELFLQAERLASLKSLESIAALGVSTGLGAPKLDLGATEKRLAEAKKVLSQVIELGDRTEKQVDGYLHNLLYPLDWDAPSEVIGDAKKFFDSHTCYSGPRDRLESQIEQVSSSVKAMRQAIQKAELKVAALKGL